MAKQFWPTRVGYLTFHNRDDTQVIHTREFGDIPGILKAKDVFNSNLELVDKSKPYQREY